MTTHFVELARRAAEDGQISPQELLSLRRQGWGDGVIHRDEAEAIFAVNNVLTERDNEWCDFFVEAIGEFVLNGTPPRLQCSLEEAEWLIAQIDRDGVVESLVELETMVRIVERAENVPEKLKNYVVQQVEREVLSGAGPTRCGGELSATHITAAECRILRRVIFASGGYGPAAVDRFDAEMLFRIKDSTLEEENAAEWGDLFVDGVANYLRGYVLPNAQLSHERKLELARFVADVKPNHGAFLGAVFKNSPKVLENAKYAWKALWEEGGIQTDFTALEAEGYDLTNDEKAWLDRMMEQDGKIDELEARVIRRVIEDA